MLRNNSISLLKGLCSCLISLPRILKDALRTMRYTCRSRRLKDVEGYILLETIIAPENRIPPPTKKKLWKKIFNFQALIFRGYLLVWWYFFPNQPFKVSIILQSSPTLPVFTSNTSRSCTCPAEWVAAKTWLPSVHSDLLNVLFQLETNKWQE